MGAQQVAAFGGDAVEGVEQGFGVVGGGGAQVDGPAITGGKLPLNSQQSGPLLSPLVAHAVL